MYCRTKVLSVVSWRKMKSEVCFLPWFAYVQDLKVNGGMLLSDIHSSEMIAWNCMIYQFMSPNSRPRNLCLKLSRALTNHLTLWTLVQRQFKTFLQLGESKAFDKISDFIKFFISLSNISHDKTFTRPACVNAWTEMEENVSVESFFGRDFRKSKSSENVICSQDILKALEELWKLLISCLLNFTAQNILNFEQLIATSQPIIFFKRSWRFSRMVIHSC